MEFGKEQVEVRHSWLETGSQKVNCVRRNIRRYGNK